MREQRVPKISSVEHDAVTDVIKLSSPLCIDVNLPGLCSERIGPVSFHGFLRKIDVTTGDASASCPHQSWGTDGHRFRSLGVQDIDISVRNWLSYAQVAVRRV